MASRHEEVMLDLETLRRSARAAISTIGACKFSGEEILDGFYHKLDAENCAKYGLEIEEDAVAWRKEQNKEVQKEISGGERLKLRAALEVSRNGLVTTNRYGEMDRVSITASSRRLSGG